MPEDQFQYVKLPDGSYGKFAANADDATIKGAISKDFPDAFAQGTIHSDAQIGAQPSGPVNYLENVQNDVKHGGTSTMFGRLLHAMGAPGTETGTTPQVSDFVASPVLGPLKTAKGVAELPSSPWQGAKDVAGGALQTATLPSAFMAPEITGAAEQGLQKVAQAIPSAKRAGQAFNEVKNVAGDIPIDLSNPGNVALHGQELASRGGSLPKVLRDFVRRATDPQQPPITFSEARDFYSNASRLSADEFNRLTPVMKRQVGMFTQALGDSLQEAAQSVGKGEQLSGAMREYARAKNLQGYGQDALKYATKSIPWAVAAYAAKQILGVK